MWLVFWPRFPRCVTANFSHQNFAQQTVMQIVAICVNSHDMIRPERIASTTVTNPKTQTLGPCSESRPSCFAKCCLSTIRRMVDSIVQTSSLLGHKTCDHIQAYPPNPGRAIRAGLQGCVLCVAFALHTWPS